MRLTFISLLLLISSCITLTTHVYGKTKTIRSQFVLSGNFIDIQEGTLIIEKNNATDTISIKNSRFYYTGVIQDPTVVLLYFKDCYENPVKVASMLILPGKTDIVLRKDSLALVKIIQGTNVQKQFLSLYKKKLNLLMRRYTLIESIRQVQNSHNQDSLNQIQSSINQIDSSFITQNKQSIITAYLIEQNLNFEKFELPDVATYYKNFPSAIKESSYGKEIKRRLMIAKNVAKGNAAPLFSWVDQNNKPLSLNSFKGKYVVLDFWASWCLPCRQLSPVLKHFYDTIPKAKFEIISISCDANINNWKAAIDKDKLGNWVHIMDKDNVIYKKYLVEGIPVLLLIDPYGNIVDRYQKSVKGYHSSPEADLFKQIKTIFSVGN